MQTTRIYRTKWQRCFTKKQRWLTRPFLSLSRTHRHTHTHSLTHTLSLTHTHTHSLSLFHSLFTLGQSSRWLSTIALPASCICRSLQILLKLSFYAANQWAISVDPQSRRYCTHTHTHTHTNSHEDDFFSNRLWYHSGRLCCLITLHC